MQTLQGSPAYSADKASQQIVMEHDEQPLPYLPQRHSRYISPYHTPELLSTLRSSEMRPQILPAHQSARTESNRSMGSDSAQNGLDEGDLVASGSVPMLDRTLANTDVEHVVDPPLSSSVRRHKRISQPLQVRNPGALSSRYRRQQGSDKLRLPVQQQLSGDVNGHPAHERNKVARKRETLCKMESEEQNDQRLSALQPGVVIDVDLYIAETASEVVDVIPAIDIDAQPVGIQQGSSRQPSLDSILVSSPAPEPLPGPPASLTAPSPAEPNPQPSSAKFPDAAAELSVHSQADLAADTKSSTPTPHVTDVDNGLQTHETGATTDNQNVTPKVNMAELSPGAGSNGSEGARSTPFVLGDLEYYAGEKRRRSVEAAPINKRLRSPDVGNQLLTSSGNSFATDAGYSLPSMLGMCSYCAVFSVLLRSPMPSFDGRDTKFCSRRCLASMAVRASRIRSHLNLSSSWTTLGDIYTARLRQACYIPQPYSFKGRVQLHMFSPLAAVALSLTGCDTDEICGICGCLPKYGESLHNCSRCPLGFHAACVSSTGLLNGAETNWSSSWKCRACTIEQVMEHTSSDLPAHSIAETIKLVMQPLVTMANGGNGLDLALHPSLHHTFVTEYGSDWLKCRLCNHIRVVPLGVAVETEVGFTCRDAFWQTADGEAMCGSESISEKAEVARIMQHMDRRSQRRSHLFWVHMGEENREKFGWPLFDDSHALRAERSPRLPKSRFLLHPQANTVSMPRGDGQAAGNDNAGQRSEPKHQNAYSLSQQQDQGAVASAMPMPPGANTGGPNSQAAATATPDNSALKHFRLGQLRTREEGDMMYNALFEGFFPSGQDDEAMSKWMIEVVEDGADDSAEVLELRMFCASYMRICSRNIENLKQRWRDRLKEFVSGRMQCPSSSPNHCEVPEGYWTERQQVFDCILEMTVPFEPEVESWLLRQTYAINCKSAFAKLRRRVNAYLFSLAKEDDGMIQRSRRGLEDLKQSCM
jgi:hypothetical protein